MPLGADVIFHKNGQKFEGIIVAETDTRVVIRMPGGELALPRSIIDHIEREDASANQNLAIDAAFRAENVLSGLKELLTAQKTEPDAEKLNQTLQDNRAAILKSIASMTSSDQTEALHQFDRLRESELLDADSLLVLAQAYLELDEPLKASDALREAGFDRLKENPETEVWVGDFLRRLIRSLVTEARYQEAVEQIERLRLLNEDTASPQLPLVYLAESARARDARNFEESLRIITQDLWPLVPEIARNRALVTLRLMTDWTEKHCEESQGRKWINRWLAAKLPLESLVAGHRLYASEAERYLREAKPGMAMRVLSQVPEDERPEDLQHIWNRAYLDAHREDIGETDPIALFELAQWASEHGLENESIELFHELKKNESLKKAAEDQSRLIRQERDLRDLQRAIEAFDKGLMTEVIDICNSLHLDEGHESANQKEILQLADLAREEMLMDQKRRPYQAEAFYQQAERAYFTSKIDESWNLIDVILTHYADTPAAQRAVALLPDVAREFEMQLLEGRRKTVPSYESTVSRDTVVETEELDREIRALLDAL